MVNFISYTNGNIRDCDGVLVAHYDSETGELHITGSRRPFYAENIEQAMDIVNWNY